MNLDITLCEGTGCPLLESCLRALGYDIWVASAPEPRAPMIFKKPPFSVKASVFGEEISCDHFVPRRTYEDLENLSDLSIAYDNMLSMELRADDD